MPNKILFIKNTVAFSCVLVGGEMVFLKSVFASVLFSILCLTSANAAPLKIEMFGTLSVAQSPLDSSFVAGESGRIIIHLADDTPDQIFDNIYRYNIAGAEFISDSYAASTVNPLIFPNVLDVFNDSMRFGEVVDFISFISVGQFDSSPLGLFELTQVNAQAYYNSSFTDGPLLACPIEVVQQDC